MFVYKVKFAVNLQHFGEEIFAQMKPSNFSMVKSDGHQLYFLMS